MTENLILQNLSKVKKIITILSGKGGVGKSSVTAQLGASLSLKGLKVAILDLDLCGPSMATMLGIENLTVIQSPEGWLPVKVSENLSCMSIQFLLPNKDSSIVWRAMIKQFFTNVCWGELDFLLIDTPPAIVEYLADLNPEGAILQVSLIDVRKEYFFCKEVGLKVLGLIENMSGYVCPNCSGCTNIFSKDGGINMCSEFNIPFLGCVPIEPKLNEIFESSNRENFCHRYSGTELYKIFSEISDIL